MKINVVNKHHGASGHYIGRGSPLGNPFTLQQYVRVHAVNNYRAYLEGKIAKNDPVICNELNLIAEEVMTKGEINLVCYCAPKLCHGDVIKEILTKAINGAISK